MAWIQMGSNPHLTRHRNTRLRSFWWSRKKQGVWIPEELWFRFGFQQFKYQWYGFFRWVCHSWGNAGRSQRTLWGREYEGEAQLEIRKQKKSGNSFLTPLCQTSLQEHLLDQLKLVDCVEGIGSLNENGFLSGTLSDVPRFRASCRISVPYHCYKLLISRYSALDLQDSLLKQMEFRGWKIQSPTNCRDHFQLLVRRRVPNFKTFYNPPKWYISACTRWELDPAPGRKFSKIIINQLPDAMVEKISVNGWSMKTTITYRGKINKTYKELISKGTLSSKKSMFVTKCVLENFWLISWSKTKHDRTNYPETLG